ncbi:MAG: CinA family protein [Lachnospiraceae bacterium]|nr:CinA family protein [Ruminococcus sp.]MCM1276449.1 CinA family protein [Lachnospiraceae bacterium]
MREICDRISGLAGRLVEKCAAEGLKISTAESCTGGMISAAVTAVPGSSAVIELGICSYSNRIKRDILGVTAETLGRFSEYSIACAEEMARGAMKISGADYAVATSGVAGPSGGTEENPVGTVYICAAGRDSSVSEKFLFENKGRDNIRAAATEKALEMLLDKISADIIEREKKNGY